MSSLNIVRHGAGEPLLMITGVSGTHASWGSVFLGELAMRFTCITYDHRGIGFSAPDDREFCVRDLAADALAVLDELELDRAHVFGVSMGGMVAQEFALAYPDRVGSLTLGCTACGGGEAMLSDEFLEPVRKAWAVGDAERAIRTMFEATVSPAFASDPNHFEAFRESALAAPVARSTIERQVLATNRHDCRSRIARLTHPPLVIHGELDEVIPIDEGRLLTELAPGARLVELSGVGHGFWWEQPTFVAGLINDHANDTVGRMN
ncbi:alpha/beta fold hydrolase [Mycolicibacterium llatzerense]|uniref:alpha/beta fold hydrolase n=1 Tax=Mycolicibacterium llatzerense TaxID=280871 RepID=UPI0021B5D03C|nr:alpha/beta hydrolase [Mycolicibacterium llatzerense]